MHGIAGWRPVMIVLAVSACSDPAGVERDGVRAESRGDALLVTNERDRDIYTFVVDQAEAAVIDWVVCEDPVTCESVAAGGARILPMPEGNANNVILYWWHLLQQPGGGFTHDSVRALVVPR